MLDLIKFGTGLGTGAVLMLAWAHSPLGDSHRLDVTRTKLGQMTEAQHVAAARSWTWKAAHDDLLGQVKRERQQAYTAFNEARSRCIVNDDRSYHAGLVAGHALERSKNANPGTDTSTRAPDAGTGRVRDFRDLYLGAGTNTDHNP